MRWTLLATQDGRRLKRTAKPCGPGAPKQALRPRNLSRTTVATKRWSPERARSNRNTIAQGRPDDLAEPVVTAACFFCCRRAMGAACTRPSLRPLYFESAFYGTNSDARRRET